jgi:hypothetical protein
MVNSQSVKQAVNKKIVIGFSVTTSDATSTDVVTAATIATAGAKTITDIHMIVKNADGYLGLGKAATTTPGEDIIPVFSGLPFDLMNCGYESLTVIRDGADVTVEGFVVVN